MSRKILILVLSYTKEPYNHLLAAQYDSWDSVYVEGVETIYYHGGLMPQDMINYHLVHRNPNRPWSKRLELQSNDEYYKMGGKLKATLESNQVGVSDYQLIFRTNSSSYVNKEELLKFAENLPLEKCYAGWTFVDSEDYGGLCVSGAGIFLSKDCAEILMDNIDPEKEIEEDVEIGRILRKHGIEAIDDKSRYDVPSQFSEIPLDRYHYRLKTGDRLQDANNMRKIHQLIINQNNNK